MIEVILAFLVSGWKENRCTPLPKMTASESADAPGEGVLPAPSVNSSEAGRSAGKSTGAGVGVGGRALQGLGTNIEKCSPSAQPYSPTRTAYHDFCFRAVSAAVGQRTDRGHTEAFLRGLPASSTVSLSLPHVWLLPRDITHGWRFLLLETRVYARAHVCP